MADQDLFAAVRVGDVEALRRLLEEGEAPNARDDRGATPLFIASANGSLELVKLLLEHGADPNISDNYEDVPINRAVVSGHLDVVRFLAENGALYHSPGIGLHPIANAAANGQLAAVRYLVEEMGVPVDETTRAGSPPLHCAAGNGHAEVVQYLIDRGADPHQTDSLGLSAFATVEGCMTLDGISEADMQNYRHILRLFRGEKQRPKPREESSRTRRWRFWR